MSMAGDFSDLTRLLQSRPRPVLASGEHRAIVGCGYVGSALIQQWRARGHAISATTRRASRLADLEARVDQAVLFDSESESNDLSFIEDIDVLVISLAPTGQQQVDLEAYRSVFSRGIERLCRAISERRSSTPLQLIQLSSCGLYGDRGGAITTEQSTLDLSHPINALLAGAEERLQALRDEHIRVCTLRLGGIYGPGREIPEWLLAAAGQRVERDGDHTPCWVHVDDVVQAIDLAAERQLNGVLNVVDDLALTKRAITDRLCEATGCAPVWWAGSPRHDRVLDASVSNAYAKGLGLMLHHPSMIDWYLSTRDAGEAQRPRSIS
ncbi:MAG: NAD-dependent epimerase/dehydratase family protein [Synechococcus sp. MED-G71]|nr:MAG: NAD-dependent epimerase/dehydratase family protein [Synechococcus sp. MED-G71]